jgi:hypothetical protein
LRMSFQLGSGFQMNARPRNLARVRPRGHKRSAIELRARNGDENANVRSAMPNFSSKLGNSSLFILMIECKLIIKVQKLEHSEV